MTEASVYILRLGGHEETSFAENVVGIGWTKARGLEAAKDWDGFKKILHAAYPDYSPRGLGNCAGSAWNFVHGMKAGSLVVVPLTGAFKVGKVLEDAPYYDDSGYDSYYAWRRKVAWTTDTPVPRTYASNTLQRRMKCQQTCIDISLLHEDLTAALNRTNPISFREELYRESRPIVAKHLLNSLTPTQLEELIAEIYKAQGYPAERLPTHQNKAGDIDVRVEIETGLGENSKPLTIGIQVKQHEGMTDQWAVQQIIDRLGVGDGIDRGIVVTTADDFDGAAKKLAEEHDVALVSRNELADWILDNAGKIAK